MARKGVHINVYRLPDGVWRCDLKINRNGAGEGMMVSGTSQADDGDTMMGWSFKGALKGLSAPGKAIAKARTVLTKILKNPAIAATFPQYALPALAALKAIEAAEKSGVLAKLRRGVQDPTLRKLVTEVDEMSQGKRTAMSGGGTCLCDGSSRRGRSAMMGASFPGEGKPSPFGLSSGLGPFGLPQGNPHPFAAWAAKQVAKGAAVDPLARQKLAAMWKHQRDMARASRT